MDGRDSPKQDDGCKPGAKKAPAIIVYTVDKKNYVRACPVCASCQNDPLSTVLAEHYAVAMCYPKAPRTQIAGF